MNAPTQVTAPPTHEIFRLARLGTRRLTRAHLALAARNTGRTRALLPPMAAALGEQLAASVELQARLLDASFLPRASLPKIAGYAVFELGAAGATAALELDLPYLVSVLGRIAGGPARIGPATSFTRLEEAAFALVCLVAVAAARRDSDLESELGPRLSLITASRAEVLPRLEDGPHLAVELTLTIGGEKGQGRLLLPARTMQVVAETFPRLTAGDLAAEVGCAGIVGRAFCGSTRLSQADVASLQPGDVVLFEDLRLVAGQVHGSARIATRLFDLVGELGPNGFSPHRANPRAFPPECLPMSVTAPEESLPPLPVEVEVELTRVRLTVSELANLRAGALVPLHINSAEPVILRIGDRNVARAELVEIEGEVGARILALLP